MLLVGVRHENLGAGPNFLVVGAYPVVCPAWDLRRRHPRERAEAVRTIGRAPRPDRDPVYGADGPVLEAWGGAR